MKIIEYFKTQKEEDEELNINFLPDGVFIIEQDGKVVDVNDKILEIYGARRYDFVGQYFSNFVEDGLQVLNQVLTEKKVATAKAITKNFAKADNKIYLEINVWRDKESNRVFIIARDNTERRHEQKAINEKYEYVQKIVADKNNFILESSAAILSSLVSITGFSRALLDGIGGAVTEKQEKYLNIINTSSRDLKYDLEKLFNLFELESGKTFYKYKTFNLISLIQSIERIYEKDFKDKKIVFTMDYGNLTQRDCNLDSEIVELILRSVMDIFARFANFGKCSLNIGHPPMDFLKERDFESNNSFDTEKYVLFEAKIADLVFAPDELENIFNIYYKGSNKRPIGLRATFNLLKKYINDFRGDIWVYSKENFGTMITFVLPLR